jgi:hypothetical protein
MCVYDGGQWSGAACLIMIQLMKNDHNNNNISNMNNNTTNMGATGQGKMDEIDRGPGVGS